MANYTEILFEKLQQAGLSVYQFSKDTGIPKGRIYQWRRGNGNPKAEDSEIIDAYLEQKLTPNNTEGAILATETFQQKLREIKLNRGKKQIPFFEASAQAGGEMAYTEMTPVSAPSGTIDVGFTGIFYIYGSQSVR